MRILALALALSLAAIGGGVAAIWGLGQTLERLVSAPGRDHRPR